MTVYCPFLPFIRPFCPNTFPKDMVSNAGISIVSLPHDHIQDDHFIPRIMMEILDTCFYRESTFHTMEIDAGARRQDRRIVKNFNELTQGSTGFVSNTMSDLFTAFQRMIRLINNGPDFSGPLNILNV